MAEEVPRIIFSYSQVPFPTFLTSGCGTLSALNCFQGVVIQGATCFGYLPRGDEYSPSLFLSYTFPRSF